MLFLDMATIACVAMLIGNELAVWVFVNPVLRRLDDDTQATAISLFASRLGAAMPFWYAGSLLLLIVEAVMRRHEAGSALLIASCAIWIAVIVLTLLFLVPINNRMAKLAPGSFTEKAHQEHDRWDTLHRLRVLALGVSMFCLFLASHV